MDELVKTERTVDAVTLEINTLHRQAQQMMLGYVIEIGKRLVEVKEMLPYGSWGTYLAERTPYSQSTANNFMKIFQEYGDENLSLFEKGTKSQTFGKLSYTQALALLALPANEREEFAQENNVEDMSSRQLQEAIRERNQAREEADRLKATAKELDPTGKKVIAFKCNVADSDMVKAAVEETMPAPRKKRKAWKVILVVFVSLLALAVVLLVAFLLVSRFCPEFLDSILYSAEELEVINYKFQ